MNTYFYSQVDKTSLNESVINFLEKYAETNLKPVFILHSPLGTNYSYEYNDAALVLTPHHKIIAINWGQNSEAFNEYYDDIMEDLGYISDKYGYKNVIGRNKVWKKEIFITQVIDNFVNFETVFNNALIENKELARLCQLIISLLTGSINDINLVRKDVPTDLLDAVKRRIILYDAKQTNFIFNKNKKKIVTVQGLAGTGKTELLLRKLKELYTDTADGSPKIAMTCFNKILAADLRARIPEFFDFLKVEEQIKWNSSLFVMRGWGASNNKNSGVYSYICANYGIEFLPYSYSTSFDYVCSIAYEKLKQYDNLTPCFDYMLIDESQDFPSSFINLCSIVTKNQIFLAGDIFQNIFDLPDTQIEPDYLLNNCYRTDPKTLIFAHALGMGIADAKQPSDYLRWLTDEEWKLCGYDIIREEEHNLFKVSRTPLNRFDDIDVSTIESVVVQRNAFDNYEETIIKWIADIRNQFPSVSPNDIGIVFLENENDNYKLIDSLSSQIYSEFGWNVNRGYDNKAKIEGEIFVSNIYNVKGLEFPFVICISKNKLSSSMKRRNAMYMILTRSFISSYLLLSDRNDDLVEEIIEKRLICIKNNGYLEIEEPSAQQKEEILQNIISSRYINRSQKEIADEIMDSKRIPHQLREKIHKSLEIWLDEDETDTATITDAIMKFAEIKQ